MLAGARSRREQHVAMGSESTLGIHLDAEDAICAWSGPSDRVGSGQATTSVQGVDWRRVRQVIDEQPHPSHAVGCAKRMVVKDPGAGFGHAAKRESRRGGPTIRVALLLCRRMRGDVVRSPSNPRRPDGKSHRIRGCPRTAAALAADRDQDVRATQENTATTIEAAMNAPVRRKPQCSGLRSANDLGIHPRAPNAEFSIQRSPLAAPAGCNAVFRRSRLEYILERLC